MWSSYWDIHTTYKLPERSQVGREVRPHPRARISRKWGSQVLAILFCIWCEQEWREKPEREEKWIQLQETRQMMYVLGHSVGLMPKSPIPGWLLSTKHLISNLKFFLFLRCKSLFLPPFLPLQSSLLYTKTFCVRCSFFFQTKIKKTSALLPGLRYTEQREQTLDKRCCKTYREPEV